MALLFVFGPTGASAALLNVVGGQLLGAYGVDVGGQLYNVEFVDGSCVTLFDGCDAVSDFPFPTQSDALVASQALLDQVLIDGGLGSFDSFPDSINGCSFDGVCDVYTPFIPLDGTAPHSSKGAIARNFAADIDPTIGVDGTLTENFDGASDTSLVNFVTFATWTLVPEPSVATLLAVGLATTAAGRRRAGGRGRRG